MDPKVAFNRVETWQIFDALNDHIIQINGKDYVSWENINNVLSDFDCALIKVRKKQLPFEIDQEYETKFQTPEKFIIKEIKYQHKKPVYFLGIYVGKEHLGNCLLNVDRLVPKFEE